MALTTVSVLTTISVKQMPTSLGTLVSTVSELFFGERCPVLALPVVSLRCLLFLEEH